MNKLRFLVLLTFLPFLAFADGDIIPGYFIFIYGFMMILPVIGVIAIASAVSFLGGRKKAFILSLICSLICYFAGVNFGYQGIGPIYTIPSLLLLLILFSGQIKNHPLNPLWYITTCLVSIMVVSQIISALAISQIISSNFFIPMAVVQCGVLFYFSRRFLLAGLQTESVHTTGITLFKQSCRITVSAIVAMAALSLIQTALTPRSHDGFTGAIMVQTIYWLVFAVLMSGLSTYLVMKKHGIKWERKWDED